MTSKPRFPGWRTMTHAERRNAKMHAIFERARELGHTGFRSQTIAAREVKPGDVLEAFGRVDSVEVRGDTVRLGYANGGLPGAFAATDKVVRMNP